MARDANCSSGSSAATKLKIIDRVLDAIANLGEKNGSSAKDILNYVLRNSKTVDRNLTVQVQQALKQAVSNGLVKLSGGRYKIRFSPKAPPPSLPTSQQQQQKQQQPRGKTSAATATATANDKRKNSSDKRRTAKASKHDKPRAKESRGDRNRPSAQSESGAGKAGRKNTSAK